MDLHEIRLDETFRSDFRSMLLIWGSENFRHFPWRVTDDPYHLLIAESLLHRTQANQVVDIYEKFLIDFPEVKTLAGVKKQRLEEDLHSLGLHWRVELIREMALVLLEDYDGRIPHEKKKLLDLPGVGPYIASSVRCFAFGYPDAIIDINVMRVLTRVLNIPFRDSLRRNKSFGELAQSLVDPEKPREYNFAILDLAHIICKPKNQECFHCPINTLCSFNLNLIIS